MSDIDVHEIKLDLRYPNSRQEDITDAFMRGYQGAVKSGNDAVRRVKAEKEVLERRIDELCQENERLREQLKASDDGRKRQANNLIDKCHKIARLQTENAKLREFATHMANVLGIDSEWCDPEWCDSDCMDEFKCRPTGDYGEIHCLAFARMTELGIEVPE